MVAYTKYKAPTKEEEESERLRGEERSDQVY